MKKILSLLIYIVSPVAIIMFMLTALDYFGVELASKILGFLNLESAADRLQNITVDTPWYGILVAFFVSETFRAFFLGYISAKEKSCEFKLLDKFFYRRRARGIIKKYIIFLNFSILLGGLYLTGFLNIPLELSQYIDYIIPVIAFIPFQIMRFYTDEDNSIYGIGSGTKGIRNSIIVGLAKEKNVDPNVITIILIEQIFAKTVPMPPYKSLKETVDHITKYIVELLPTKQKLLKEKDIISIMSSITHIGILEITENLSNNVLKKRGDLSNKELKLFWKNFSKTSLTENIGLNAFKIVNSFFKINFS